MTTSLSEQQKLMEEGQGLVYSLATRIYRNIPIRADFEDLVAYGELGLAEAARDFDPEKNTQFTTFAYYRIRGAIYDGISKMSWASRAAYRRARRQQMSIEEARDKTESPGSSNDMDKAAESAGEKFPHVTFTSETGQVEELIEDNAESAHVVIARGETVDRLVKLVSDLPPQESLLIRTIYFEDATLQEASVRLGISKSWASRIHTKVLEQLAHSLRLMGVDG